MLHWSSVGQAFCIPNAVCVFTKTHLYLLDDIGYSFNVIVDFEGHLSARVFSFYDLNLDIG